MSTTRAGVIGLGAMGFQMARHIVNNGFSVAGFDVAADAAARAADAGVKIVDNPAEVGAQSDIVIVMVATDEQVEDVIIRSGMLDRLSRGAVICVSSSTSPETARELEQSLRRARYWLSGHARSAGAGSCGCGYTDGILRWARRIV